MKAKSTILRLGSDDLGVAKIAAIFWRSYRRYEAESLARVYTADTTEHWVIVH